MKPLLRTAACLLLLPLSLAAQQPAAEPDPLDALLAESPAEESPAPAEPAAAAAAEPAPAEAAVADSPSPEPEPVATLPVQTLPDEPARTDRAQLRPSWRV